MAGVARGINSKVQAWQEVTYAVTPGSPSSEAMYYESFKLAPAIAQIIDATMSGGLRGQLQPILGNKDITGQISAVLAPQSCAKYLANLIGAPTITNLGTGKNQFVFAPGPGALALPVGMGFEVDYGANMANADRFIRLAGNRVSKCGFTFGSSGFIKAVFDLIGSNFDLSQTTTIATPTDYGHTGFSMFNAVLTEGGGAYADMQQVVLNWDNDSDNSLYTINAGGVRGELPEGMLKISGTVQALFKTKSLLTKALNNTSSALNITVTNGSGDGTVGNELLVFNIPGLTYALAGPTIEGPKGLMVKLNFTSFRGGGAEDGTTVTLKAARAVA